MERSFALGWAGVLVSLFGLKIHHLYQPTAAVFRCMVASHFARDTVERQQAINRAHFENCRRVLEGLGPLDVVAVE